jgi:transcriptional regulator with XRE-family HTH domain
VNSTTRVTWEDFGPFLRRLRVLHGLSQARLAQHLGCHRIHIYRLEHGSRHPSKVLLRALRHTPTLTPTSADCERLGHFELLLEYRCAAVEVCAAPRYLPIRA